MPKIVDQTGNRFGKLVVLGLAGKSGHDRKCRVRCDCGTVKEIVQTNLTKTYKPTKSCGCLSKENHHITHGLSKHKWYPIWKAMLCRCYSEPQKSYKDYGGRGITVCSEWKSSPVMFLEWLEQNGYKKGLQIDRKDNDGNYCPENCRVVSPKQNSNNTRKTIRYNVDGEDLTIGEMAEKYDIKYGTLYKRIKILNLSVDQALNFKLWYRAQPERR
jgi:hypothetical protein